MSYVFINSILTDIPIFGHCPTAEILELAICNFCGDKLKLPALLDHISKYTCICGIFG